MRAVRHHEFGGPEKLQIDQIPQAELNGENVLIQVTRAGVSPLDDEVRGGIRRRRRLQQRAPVPCRRRVQRRDRRLAAGHRHGASPAAR